MTLDRITTDPARLNGRPCIRSLRLTVRRVLDILATYRDRAAIRRDCPELEDEDIAQALAYAGSLLDDAVIERPRPTRCESCDRAHPPTSSPAPASSL